MSLPDPKTEVAIPTGADPDDYVSGADFNAVLAALVEAPTWHLVGGSGEPAFTNSWVNYGSAWQVARFTKDHTGRVFLGGVVKSGSAAAIFTLPVGYRPAAAQLIAIVISTGLVLGYLQIEADGVVGAYGTGVGTLTSMCGVSFATN